LELKAPGFPHWHLISLDHKLLETRNEKGSKGDQNEVTTSDAICVGAEPESPLFQPKFVVEAVQSQKNSLDLGRSRTNFSCLSTLFFQNKKSISDKITREIAPNNGLR
jgi:hypothetical protein